MPKSLSKPLKKQPRKDFALILGALVALAIALGVGAFVVWRHTAMQGSGFAGIAQVIPQSAQVVVAVNTDTRVWQNLAQFGNPEAKQVIAQAIAQSPLSILLKQAELDFGQDVQPWVGDRVAVALVPIANNSPATVVIAKTTNAQKSQAFLQKYRSALTQQGANFTEKSESGINYHVSPSATANVSIVTAHIDDRYLMIATNETVLPQIISTYKNNQDALANQFTFQTALRQPTSISAPLVQAYMKGSTAIDLVTAQTNLKPGQAPQPLEAIALQVGVQREGLRWEIDSHLKEAKDNIQTSPNQVLKSLPDNAFFVISGSNPAQSWQNLTAQAKGNSSSEQLLQQIRQSILDTTGWEIERDLLPWTRGEFAIALVSSNQGILNNTGFGLALLLQTTDATATNSALQKLDQKVQTARGGLFPTGLEVKTATNGVNWQVGNTIVANRAVTPQGYVLWTTGELLQQFLPTPTRPLPDSPNFQLLTAQLATTNGGHFYLHMTSALGVMDKLIPREVRSNPTYLQARTILDTIEGIAVVSSPVSDRTARLELLFTLKPIPAR